jgi:hypothetical protein
VNLSRRFSPMDPPGTPYMPPGGWGASSREAAHDACGVYKYAASIWDGP